MARIRILFCMLVVSMLLTGCGKRIEQPPFPAPPVVEDFSRYPQNLMDYASRLALPEAPLLTEAEQKAQTKRYLQRFFAAWDMRKASVPRAEAFADLNAHLKRGGWGANLLPVPDKRWSRVRSLSNMNAYPSMAQPAIITANTSLRMAPDEQPFFRDPDKAGEGYPFDYFQYSALWAGMPVLVVHTSSDGEWVLCESPVALGWVRTRDVAFVNDKFMKAYKTDDYAAILQDNTPLRGGDGTWYGKGHIGAVFPVSEATQQGLVLRVPVRGADGGAGIREVTVEYAHAARMPLPVSAAAIAMVGNTMLQQPYGWGGFLENRDCSATLRDLFTPFGIWLPRNSSVQARAGQLVDLMPYKPEKREAVILQQGRPFFSFIWMRGHIGLYLGAMDDGEGHSVPLMFHNVWGVRTGGKGRTPEGRLIVGRAVVSSLHVGEEYPDVQENWMLERIRGLTLLPPVVQ
ncbi:NlpC/P60 family N-terminal domain-containing protein [Oleidesulfovibrio sp.]|uniref:NlpC/P60 family N-terminal domain-containing protein n=1 Tax=Oleidesulfovibrio sp. TaxID=2909707 RepID=UPI003A8AA68B